MQIPHLGLDAVIATEELNQRPSRPPDHAEEAQALLTLTQALSAHPEEIFQQLCLTARKLTRAESAGVSLLNAGAGRFVWPAVDGGLANYVKAGTPSDFGPCGTVIEGRRPVLFQHPERHFDYLASITPPLEEVLLSPFFLKGEPVGTVWAVMHTAGKSSNRKTGVCWTVWPASQVWSTACFWTPRLWLPTWKSRLGIAGASGSALSLGWGSVSFFSARAGPTRARRQG